jgi:hypothetical protein
MERAGTGVEVMKICSKCGKEKPFSSFSKHYRTPDKLQFYCKSCERLVNKKWRDSNLGRRRETISKWRKENSEKILEYSKKYRSENWEKVYAGNALRDAVRRGKIHKPVICSKCSGGGIIDGHHEDYSKPLRVEWLCRTCHKANHKT